MSLADRDRAVVWHPFTQAQTAAPPLPVVAASGSWLQLANGSRVFDAISSWWTCLIGHGHPRLVAAIAQQAATLDHVLFAGCTHPGAVELAEKLVARAPAGLTRVFYSDDGSTAVEVALKMAIQSHAQNGQPQRTRFLALAGGYHGDTFGAMSVGDPADFAGPFAKLLWPVTRLAVPMVDGDPLAAQLDLAPALAALEQILQAQGDTLAAVIVEPLVQGAGGMRFYPPAFLAQLAARVRAHGGLVIADEVMTGFGRTGRLFACEHARLAPDLLCVAKGLTGGILPLAATLATDAIFQAFLGPDARTALLHGHSFTANPIACAAALASMQVAEDEHLLQNAQALHRLYSEILPPLLDLPDVRAVRWLGGIGVLELRGGGYHDAARSRQIAAFCLARGVLIRPLGPVIYTLPPLGSDPHDVAHAWQVIAAACTECPARL
jgi:adenosylmethionine-8-amino-7-oxononanoate aminotransferase